MCQKTKVTFTKLKKSKEIHEEHEVRVTTMNHLIEVLSISKEPAGLLKIRKLDKHRYVLLETGEILEYDLSENRSNNIGGLKTTFRKIRHLINNNFTGAPNELFVTLSYAENMTDTKRLMRDFEVFMKRFRRKYPNTDYISVVEPQARGAWHCHVLIKFNDKEKIFIKNNDVIAPMWGHGFTKTKSLKNIDNIGAYLNAYLTDIEVCEENFKDIMRAHEFNDNAFMTVEINDGQAVTVKNHDKVKLEFVEKEIDEDGKKVKKHFAKGARLHMYPCGMNLYRCSRGIKKPETVKMEYGEVKKSVVGSATPNYTRTIELSQDEKVINSITYEQYNLKRKNVKGK